MGAGACLTVQRILELVPEYRLIILTGHVESSPLVIIAFLINKLDEIATRTTKENIQFLVELIKQPERNILSVVSF